MLYDSASPPASRLWQPGQHQLTVPCIHCGGGLILRNRSSWLTRRLPARTVLLPLFQPAAAGRLRHSSRHHVGIGDAAVMIVAAATARLVAWRLVHSVSSAASECPMCRAWKARGWILVGQRLAVLAGPPSRRGQLIGDAAGSMLLLLDDLALCARPLTFAWRHSTAQHRPYSIAAIPRMLPGRFGSPCRIPAGHSIRMCDRHCLRHVRVAARHPRLPATTAGGTASALAFVVDARTTAAQPPRRCSSCRPITDPSIARRSPPAASQSCSTLDGPRRNSTNMMRVLCFGTAVGVCCRHCSDVASMSGRRRTDSLPSRRRPSSCQARPRPAHRQTLAASAYTMRCRVCRRQTVGGLLLAAERREKTREHRTRRQPPQRRGAVAVRIYRRAAHSSRHTALDGRCTPRRDHNVQHLPARPRASNTEAARRQRHWGEQEAPTARTFCFQCVSLVRHQCVAGIEGAPDGR